METHRIDQAISASKEQFYQDLAQLIKIKSVAGPAKTGAPFGEGPRAALDLIVQLGDKYGFKTKIVNDAMAYVQWGEDNDHYLGVIDHLDVVPVSGNKWQSDPWTLTKRDNRFYARGILDNKGPAFATLWGMKLLKELGFKPKRTIRLVFGSDEETGSRDVGLYLQAEEPPDFGWTADCKFPVVYGERGIVNFSIHTEITDGSLDTISDFSGDMRMDHVPDTLTVQVDGQKVTATGKSVPSNAPELGVNAITEWAKQMCAANGLSGQLQDYCRWLVTDLADQHYGEGLNMAFSDQDSGKLIMTPTAIVKEKTGMRIDLAFRYPVSFTEEQVKQRLAENLPANSKISVIRSIPSVMHDPHDPFIKKLSEVYTEVTGKDGTPVTTTGATYSRVMPNIIAFGPSFPGQKGIAHKENEWMNEQDLLLNMKIYMLALLKIAA
ncbi:Sapep family Mn(2+)-dependent dipeptidase [Lactobacillus sp. ESL0731]|uniref:Sapep family Mn(2+)-dependent dipeptidase n=1 Tax=unclassified Lactobacillus TaxID=2620435 RepID=UPI0023F7907E|nr:MULTISPECIES: Sapep family Mn(2+)-dependent dipeptidase [unclassified Lactobacillus]WEV51745.1 Sapep family Mn(2+)-dependent dipeptidase [Lactobacillus sp. ESL0700]WEV62874.1 Sapep family Mn(2+)-dependent dipeptidase [Lactobacillus sp. ESL0731]